tara:strand:- start:1258 stop:2016 length:759 start_codon:yes stop_codon:yes gene_type:complete
LGPQHAAAILEVGGRVVLGDVDLPRASEAAERLCSEFGADSARALALDVTSPESVAEALARSEEAGGVEILINNAAINPQVSAEGIAASRLETFSLAEWDRQLAVGLSGAFLCSQSFGTRMAERGRGVILNVASDLALIAPDQRIYRQEGLAEHEQPTKPVCYSVIKSGLIGLTRYLAGYWAKDGVRVNAISPGGVQTDQPEDFVQRLCDLIPLGRMAALDEYRAAVQFLCSDGSRYMTGQNLVVAGGRTIL